MRGLLSTELTERKDEISKGGNQCSLVVFRDWVGLGHVREDVGGDIVFWASRNLDCSGGGKLYSP